MDKSPESGVASLQSIPATLQALIDSTRAWLGNFVDLAVLEGKKGGVGLAIMLGLGIGAFILLLAGWLAILGCVAAALTENNLLNWAWTLLILGLLNFAGAGGLIFLAVRRTKDLLFAATRRQLSLKSPPSESS